MFLTRTQEPYEYLLTRDEWDAKRSHIMNRDNYTCQHCGRQFGQGTHLQVHHKRYIIGLDPWEYNDTDLITLCEACHNDLHLQEEVPVYRLEGNHIVGAHFTPCSRCGGRGWIPEYAHVQGGICFRCYGAKYDEIIPVVEEYAAAQDISPKEILDLNNNYTQTILATKWAETGNLIVGDITVLFHIVNGQMKCQVAISIGPERGWHKVEYYWADNLPTKDDLETIRGKRIRDVLLIRRKTHLGQWGAINVKRFYLQNGTELRLHGPLDIPILDDGIIE